MTVRQVSDGSDVIIPVGDVYNSFISNDILDMTHFSDDDAKSTEKAVHKTFSSNKKAVLKKLKKMLNSSGDCQAYKDQSKEYQAYLSYLVNDMLTSNNKVLLSGKIDSSDKTYKAWHDSETINIKKYLNYAISKNWIRYFKINKLYAEERENIRILQSYTKHLFRISWTD